MRRLLTRLGAAAAAAALAFTLGPPAAQAAPADQPDPVVFVHGFVGKGSQWSSMRQDFLDNGYPADRLHVFTYDWTQSNRSTAEQLHDYITGVRVRTGATQVDVVTHSMGGLSSRWYIRYLGGADVVDDWVSIGGPNNGTRVAGFCSTLLTSCREMKRGSGFLGELNDGDPTPPGVTYTTFRSPAT